MVKAHDIYAETNPAFCAVVLSEFCRAHIKRSRKAPSLIIIFFVLPIVLSEDLAATFEGTNQNTGLLVWIHRNPAILQDLAKRINATLPLTTDAVSFGCMAHLLKLDEEGNLSSMNKPTSKTNKDGMTAAAFKRAKLLGEWVAGTGSSRAVFEALGVSV